MQFLSFGRLLEIPDHLSNSCIHLCICCEYYSINLFFSAHYG